MRKNIAMTVVIGTGILIVVIALLFALLPH